MQKLSITTSFASQASFAPSPLGLQSSTMSPQSSDYESESETQDIEYDTTAYPFPLIRPRLVSTWSDSTISSNSSTGALDSEDEDEGKLSLDIPSSSTRRNSYPAEEQESPTRSFESSSSFYTYDRRKSIISSPSTLLFPVPPNGPSNTFMALPNLIDDELIDHDYMEIDFSMSCRPKSRRPSSAARRE